MSRRRFALFLLVLGILIVLTPLASASPPDPLWIAGTYEADDPDDAVEAATLQAAAIVIEVVPPAEPLSPVGVLPADEPSAPHGLALSSCASRAPPVGS